MGMTRVPAAPQDRRIHAPIHATDLPSAVKARGVPFQPQSQLGSCLIQSLYGFSQSMPYKQSSFIWDFYPWHRWLDSNQRIMGSKPIVLPLHYTRIWLRIEDLNL